jgi:hypothetical protein
MEGLVMDAVLADVDQILGAAQAARRGAADLDVGLLADRCELEHRVEGRDLQHADIGHVEHVGDDADRGFRHPALVLLLRPPEDGDDGGSLAARRILRDLLPGECEVLLRERKARGLDFLRC